MISDGCSRRRAVAALLFALLAALTIEDLRLAIIFSPLLVLAALLVADRRVQAAVVEFLHALAPEAKRQRPRRKLSPVRRIEPDAGTHRPSSLGSRAPPQFSF